MVELGLPYSDPVADGPTIQASSQRALDRGVRLADEVVVLRHGKVVERGSASQVFQAPQTPYTQALIAAAFNLEAIGADNRAVAT